MISFSDVSKIITVEKMKISIMHTGTCWKSLFSSSRGLHNVMPACLCVGNPPLLHRHLSFKGSSIIVIIFTSVHSVHSGGGGQGRPYAFLNDVF